MGLVLLEVTKRRETGSKVPREINVREQQGKIGTTEQHKELFTDTEANAQNKGEKQLGHHCLLSSTYVLQGKPDPLVLRVSILHLLYPLSACLFFLAPAFDGFLIALENHYSDRLESVDIMEQLTKENPSFLIHTSTYTVSTVIGSAAIPPANFDFWILEKLASLQIHLFKLPCDYDFYHKRRKAESIQALHVSYQLDFTFLDVHFLFY